MPEDLRQISHKLEDEECKILEAKYSAPVIYKLSEIDVQLHAQALLLRIHVITGWRIPNDDYLNNILEDQFIKKLKEDYSNCNVKEIEYAFRKYGTKVKDWGKDVNLNLIDTVMDDYLKERRSVSEMEERLKSEKEERIIPTDEEILNGNRELIEIRYQDFLNKQIASYSLMPENGMATLAIDGFCEFDLYKDYLIDAVKKLKSIWQKDVENYRLLRKTALAEKTRKDIDLLNEERLEVIILAKKIALVFCFIKFKEQNYKHIYVKEK